MENAALSGGQMACSMLFGTAIITYLGLEISRLRVLMLDGVDPASRHVASKHSEPLAWTFPSLYAFFRDVAALGLVLLVAFMCEKYPLFPRGEKSWDGDMYWFLCLLLLVASVMTMRKGKSTDILNRDQTEEWKGWMQFMFLLYHYYKAEEVYNAIRIMITCYVWMTGFGNFSFFYIKQDFGVVRFLQMLWRLNFLVILLCLSQGNTYILYYICPLHTFYFLLVYATMRVLPKHNHGKWDVRFKLLGVGLLIYVVWDLFEGEVFKVLFSPFLSTAPVIGAKAGTLWEWYFRTSLDHWSTLLGMIFALNFPMATRWLTKLEEQSVGEQVRVKGLTGLCVAAPFLWWVWEIFPRPKLEYNLTNGYFGFIPLLAYIFFRNLTPGLRVWHSALLHDIGKVTLETYLMQHHVWLTSNAKTLLVLLPGFPKCNLVVVSVIFVFLSRQTFYITMSLRGMVLPDDRRRCVTGAVATLILLGALLGLGWVFTEVGAGFPVAVFVSAVAAMVLLALIHRHLNLNLWGQARHGPSGSGGLTGLRAPSSPESVISLGRVLCTLALTTCLLSLPLRHLSSGAQSGQNSGGSGLLMTPAEAGGKAQKLAVSGQPSSHAAMATTPCLALLNEMGAWSKGGNEWMWNREGEMKCGFRGFDQGALRALYSERETVIMGDSLGRKYYFSLLAGLGYPAPEANNTEAKIHQDLGWEGAKEEKMDISFLWRPYAKDVVEEIQLWGEEGRKPGLVVLSFGLWDTLHNTPAADFDAALETLNQVLKTMGEGTGGDDKVAVGASSKSTSGILRLWLMPTTIVDSKLLTADKQERMTEAQVATVRRRTYESLVQGGGVQAVLDGRIVSRGQEERSLDGVHYDDAVYDALMQMGTNALVLWEKSGGGDEMKDKSKEVAIEGAGRARRARRERFLFEVDARPSEDIADWEPWISLRHRGHEGLHSIQWARRLQDGVAVNRTLASGVGIGGASPSISPQSLKSKQVDGSMSSPMHGAIILAILLVMLFTMDSYFGASIVGRLLACSSLVITWEEAYEPLLSKLLRTPSYPGSAGIGGGLGTGNSGGNSAGGSGVGPRPIPHHAGGAVVRGRYTPVPQSEIELGTADDRPESPSNSGTSATSEE